MKKSFQLLVIGGGAAGLMAAGYAAELGLKVALIEKNQFPGRKLAITGKGRCNLTNLCTMQEFLKEINVNSRFVKPSLLHFTPDQTLDFFHSIGIETVTERGSRVFPATGRAPDVVKKMEQWCRKGKVALLTGSQVVRLLVSEGKVSGVEISKENTNEIILAPHVILATGGLGYPGTGSTGDGFRIARESGHSVTPLLQSLVAVITSEPVSESMQKLTLKNVAASVWIDGKKVASEFGELAFHEKGLTGPVILTLSRKVSEALSHNAKVEISVDLKPALDEAKLDQRLIRDLNTLGTQPFKAIMKELLPYDLHPVCVDQTQIPAYKTANQISGSERKRLKLWLKNFRFKIMGLMPWSETIITAGGVDVSEIDSKSLESNRIKGLYFAGEILDVDANTGGYNLQIAFSTARLAAWAIHRKIEKENKDFKVT